MFRGSGNFTPRMGNKLFAKSKDGSNDGHVSKGDYEMIKTVWQVVEADSAYYGFSFCIVLFRNHPEYAKYFEEESIPEFVQESRVKKKFTIICDIICALFVDYHNNPSQRDYLLGYIAMTHMDMGLKMRDFENFMSDLLEMLVQELPDILTEECIAVQKRFLNNLMSGVVTLMEKKRLMLGRLKQADEATNKWRVNTSSRILYGYPLKYWLSKKRYWEYRRAIWSSVEAEAMAPYRKNNSFVDTVKEMRVNTLSHRHDHQRSEKSRQNDQKQTKDIHKKAKKRIEQVSNNTTSSKFNPMVTIPKHRRTERGWIPAGKSKVQPTTISRPHAILKTVHPDSKQGIDAPASTSTVAARERRRKRV